VLQRRCYWKLADTPNIVLMHYRSPSMGKRSGQNSPPTAATPLTVQGRIPSAGGFLAPADASGNPSPEVAVNVSGQQTDSVAQMPPSQGCDHAEDNLHGVEGNTGSQQVVTGVESATVAAVQGLPPVDDMSAINVMSATEHMNRANWDSSHAAQQNWYNNQLVRPMASARHAWGIALACCIKRVWGRLGMSPRGWSKGNFVMRGLLEQPCDHTALLCGATARACDTYQHGTLVSVR
jgi:hypothetical protein